jgi:ABC-type transport system involved in cytochrome c biogenesis permease component
MTVSNDPRPANRFLMLAGHYAYLGLVAVVVVDVADDGAAFHVPGLRIAAGAVWILWLVAALLADDRYHTSRLCERCIAATPLDPQAAVERRMRWLQLHHETRWQMLALVPAVALELWLGTSHGWLSIAADLLLICVISLSFGSEYIHRRLYPWCPMCRWRDGGDHEVSPDVPAPVVSR